MQYICRRYVLDEELDPEPPHPTPDNVVVRQVLNGTNSSNNRTSVIDVLVAGVPHKGSVHSVNPCLKLVLGHPPAIAEHLSTNVLTNRGGTIQLEQHVGLQKVLGPVHVEISDAGSESHPLLLYIPHHLLLVKSVSHEVDSPEASVLVARVEALEAVRHVGLGTVGGQVAAVVGATTHAAVPVAYEGVGHHQGDVVRVGPAAALHSKSYMSQGHSVVTHTHVRASVAAVHVKRDLVGVDVVDLGQVLVSKIAEFAVLHATSSSQDHAGALVVSLDVVHKVVSADGLDVLGWSQDGSAQGGSLVGHSVKVVKDDLLKIHLHLLHLPENDAPTNSTFGEQEIERERD